MSKATRIVLVEGNYLLLDTPPWNMLAEEFDLKVSLEVPLYTLEMRLVRRWLDQGMSAKHAAARAGENDLINAKLVIEKSLAPDVILSLDEEPI